MSEMRITGTPSGTKIIWNADEPVGVKSARRSFDEHVANGYAAFSVKGDGGPGEQITEFDPDAEKVILIPPVRGG